jgi:hypothetical protein
MDEGRLSISDPIDLESATRACRPGPLVLWLIA